METSARDKINIEECFDELIRQMRIRPPVAPEKEKRRLNIPGFGGNSQSASEQTTSASSNQDKKTNDDPQQPTNGSETAASQPRTTLSQRLCKCFSAKK